MNDVKLVKKDHGITGEVLLQKFHSLCKQLRSVFPQAKIIFLGTSRTWRFQGKNRHVLGGIRVRHFQRLTLGCNTLENKKRNLSSFMSTALPVFRYLRNDFYRQLKRCGYQGYPISLKGRGIRNVFFNDVFHGLSDLEIWDQYGHLSDLGARKVGVRFEQIARAIQD